MVVSGGAEHILFPLLLVPLLLIAGREGGRTPLREKRGHNGNLLEISMMTPWKPLQRKRWTRCTKPPTPAYTAKRGLSKNLLKISITTTWKISPRPGNLSNSTTTSSYCSHCNLLVARLLLRTDISPQNATLLVIVIPCCPPRLSVPSRLLTGGAVAVVCRRLMIWEAAPFLPGN